MGSLEDKSNKLPVLRVRLIEKPSQEQAANGQLECSHSPKSMMKSVFSSRTNIISGEPEEKATAFENS